MTDLKQPENVECVKHLGSMITNDARCTWGMKFGNAMVKAAFKKKKKKDVSTSKLVSYLKKGLVRCYIRSTALHGAETWTLRKTDQKYLKSSELWCWRRMENRSFEPIV